MTYKGKYRVKNISKYKGDPTKVIYRSLWERQLMRWLDENNRVSWWSSESLIIPYRCVTDNRVHRYFVDFQIKFIKGPLHCIEVKPEAQTEQPQRKKGKREKRHIEESLTYAKNISKWNAAREYCLDRGWKFQVWTEKTLTSLGIKLLLKS